MPIPFIMPKVDMDQENATVASWLKKEGDCVKADEIVLIVETEKIAIEVPAPADGILAGICVHPGDVVPVTQVIAYILKEGETLADLPAAGGPQPGPAVVSPASPVKEAEKAAPAVAATPVAMRMAKDLGVELSKVPSENVRITRGDLERYLASAASTEGRVKVAASPAARRLAREIGVDIETVSGSGPRQRVQAQDVAATTRIQAPTAPPVSSRPAEGLPLAGMRRTIAERMQTSFHDAPHISLTVEADVTRLEAVRSHMNELASRRKAGKVSLTALLVRILAWALERHPFLNASLVDGQISLWKDVNIGVATALPDGLIVPVIHGANRKTIAEIVAALQDLTTRAREGRLNLGDVQHGTFTISNLGMFGIRQFRAIINPPESAILAVGAVTRKPVVIDDQDTVAVRPILSLTLSADHRLIDGLAAARFLADLVQAVEMPEIILY